MFILLIFAVVLIFLTWWYLKVKKFNSYLSRYKGPRVPIFSSNVDNVKYSAEFLQTMTKWFETYGNSFVITAGLWKQLYVADHKVLEHLLKSTTLLKKSSIYNYIKQWLGNGLLTSGGSEWKKQRKLITPAFHFQILEPFIEVFNAQSRILVNKLKKHVDGPSFDLYNYITLCALDIICETSMGTSVNAQDDPHSKYVESIKGMAKVFMNRIFSTIKSVDFLYRYTEDYRKEKYYLKIMHSYAESVIVQRQKELTENLENVHNLKTNKKIPLLDLLLQSSQNGKRLAKKQIREQVDTFLFEGHDTVSSGISFALYAIANNPEIQDKIVAELRNIFLNDKNRLCTYNDLQEMHYLNMVVKESLRLYPPVLLFGRTLDEDLHLDDHILPKGLSVTAFTYALHRREDIFPDPEKFDPERFSPINIQNMPQFAYLPFSAGVRNCIGQRFAMLEMKTVVCEVLRHYELSTIPGEEPILFQDMLLKSANGILVQLKKRNF